MLRTNTLLRTQAIAAALVLTGMAGTPAQAEGLFDFLFGGSRSQQPTYQPRYDQDYEPLEMRVSPRRERRKVVRARPEGSEKAKLATPIDIKANPNWHLIDPTLRRGDIVVLKGQVLVYDGRGRSAGQDDFTSLGRSRLISKTERLQIERMAGLPLDVAPAGAKQTDADAEQAKPTLAQSRSSGAVQAAALSLTP